MSSSSCPSCGAPSTIDLGAFDLAHAGERRRLREAASGAGDGHWHYRLLNHAWGVAVCRADDPHALESTPSGAAR